jgi:hypothetical protein
MLDLLQSAGCLLLYSGGLAQGQTTALSLLKLSDEASQA